MYEPFYRLSAKPFQLNPDPAFFYESRVHKRAYAYLEYGLYQGEGFIVITGEVGAGKTLLVRNLLSHLDSEQFVAAHLVSTQLDAQELLRAVSVSFGLAIKATDKASLLAELEQFLSRLATQGKRALLIVDEAQNLTPRAVEELRMLSNFQVGGQALLQSFLVGQPELRQTMQDPSMQQFRQRVIASYHLSNLDPAETRAYIEHRLKRAGWRGDPRFEYDAHCAIFAFTDGIPRRVNLLCNRLLVAGYLSEKHELDAADVEAVGEELREELDVIGRPGELTATQRAKIEAELEARPDATLLSEWHGGVDAPGHQTTDESHAHEPGALLPRVVRLENAMTRVLGMLRPRSK
jgi:putative secretion ATPase (PEP-CTERM system associated)